MTDYVKQCEKDAHDYGHMVIVACVVFMLVCGASIVELTLQELGV
jgi:hypothetical protein